MEVTISKLEDTMMKAGRNSEALDLMLGRFNRMVQQSGILSEVKKHTYYEKPSAKRRRRMLAAKLKMERNKRDALRNSGEQTSFRPKHK
jgi:small subunit ribosomal protein S21